MHTLKNAQIKNEYLGRDLEAMSFAKNYYHWIIDELKSYIGKNVAEVGAGSGNLTELVMEHVDYLVAFEPSGNMCSLLKKRFELNQKIKIINGMFDGNSKEFDSYFDSIIYANVLEHVESDKKELLIVHQKLVDGGHALIFVPALSLLYSDFDKKIGHYRRYCKQDFERLAASIGFKIKKIKYIDFVGIIPWYIFFVLLKNQLTTKKVLLYDKLIIPTMQKIEKVILPPAGKNLLVVMQK